MDIHQCGLTFVRLVLGLSSPNESILGLDTSVQWTIDQESGRKVAGTLTLEESVEGMDEPKIHVFDLNMNELPKIRPTIRGRGTTAWSVVDPVTQEEILVKDSWRSGSYTAESDFLQAAKSIAGVVQMIAFQDICAETRDYWPSDICPTIFRNRQKLRVAMKKYGKSIWKFKTRVELIRAIRDALVGECFSRSFFVRVFIIASGHRELFRKGILHRDVSAENILLANMEDLHGVLIDLDIAVWVKDNVSPVPANPGLVSGVLYHGLC